MMWMTPDALVNVLNAIHGVLEGKGKVITVVGAGGNRDKGKRPIMAKESARLSDRVIITSDNPRFEEPQDIINDMLAGLDKDDLQKTISIADRKEAIKTACMLAQPGDVILVAGKGHENYQDHGDRAARRGVQNLHLNQKRHALPAYIAQASLPIKRMVAYVIL